MDSDLEKYGDKYFNISKEELKKLRAENDNDLQFEAKIKYVHQKREWEKKHGSAALRTQPLAHVLSVCIHSEHKDTDKPLVIYGQIYAEIYDSSKGNWIMHDLYKRDRDTPEIITGTHRKLTLNGPKYSCYPDYACMPLFKNRINVELFNEFDEVFARNLFNLDESDLEGVYEQVRFINIQGEKGSLNIEYVAIPLGIHCRIELWICSRNKGVEKHDDNFVNINGMVVARYGKTYGNYSSEECVLFDKNTEFERVEIDGANALHLSRCWMSLPVYSSLVVGLNLTEFETRRNIVNDTIELSIQSWGMTSGSILLDDIAIKVHAAWFSPELFGGRIIANYDSHYSSTQGGFTMEGFLKEETKEMDIERENESSSDESDAVLPSSPKCPWNIHPHQSKPWSSPAIEIFSVIFGREMSKMVQIYGSIEILSGNDDNICYIFKRDEHDALMLPKNVESTHIADGSRIFDDCISLKMKCDIKDVENRLAIRGLVDWDASTLDTLLWHEKQLCSVVPGQHGGFVSIHYSIFSEAVYASIKVFLSPKIEFAHAYPMVWGSLIAQYNCYDYSSSYNKQFFRCILFERVEDDKIQVNDEMSIPLSRSVIVVPLYSDLILNVELLFGVSSQVSCVKHIRIGESFKTEETNDCLVRIELDWCEIK